MKYKKSIMIILTAVMFIIVIYAANNIMKNSAASTVLKMKNAKSFDRNLKRAANGSEVQTKIKNVNFRIDEDIIIKIERLQGELVPTSEKGHPILDDKKSFKLNIYNGIFSFDTKSLSNLLNRYVFNYEGSALKDLKVSIEGSKLKQEGEMKGIPFTLISEISATEKGKIKLHPVEVNVIGVEVSGLMDFFKIELDELLKSNKDHGVTVKNNDLFLDPSKMLPPPEIKGNLVDIKVSDERIKLIFFTKHSEPLKADTAENNYMYFKEGKLSFGKLTMHETDMEIIDMDKKDIFDFYLEKYLDQLTAGYHKTTEKNGLIVYMPDYNDIVK